MNDQVAQQSVTPPPAGAAGAMLLSERRRQGLSLGDISRQLKLSVRQVEALERDDYSGYKSPVFIHGFIRNYAKLLGLDPDPLIRATDAMLNPPLAAAVPQREPEATQSSRETGEKPRLWPAAAIVVVVAIALFIAFGPRRAADPNRGAAGVASLDKPSTSAKSDAKPGADPRSQESRPELSKTESPRADNARADAAGRPDAKSRAEPEPAVKSPPRAADLKSESGKVVEPKSSAAKPADAKAPSKEVKPSPRKDVAEQGAQVGIGGAIASEPAGRITVRMVFEQDSWVEIKDRNGNTIFGQLNATGSRRSVSGEPPLSIVVGNAAGVRLYQGDKSIDLGPYTRVDVARLTLE